jgi:hypothetical protein
MSSVVKKKGYQISLINNFFIDTRSTLKVHTKKVNLYFGEYDFNQKIVKNSINKLVPFIPFHSISNTMS